MEKPRMTVILGLCLLFAVGCGPSKGLEGSLSVLMDLSYQKAEVLQSNQELVVRFSQPQGSGENTVFKVTYFLDGTQVTPNREIDLSGVRESGGPKTVASRDVLNDPRTTFPDVLIGGLTLSAVPVSGQSLKGSLHITFTPCIDFGCGRTVFGDFEASVP